MCFNENVYKYAAGAVLVAALVSCSLHKLYDSKFVASAPKFELRGSCACLALNLCFWLQEGRLALSWIPPPDWL